MRLPKSRDPSSDALSLSLSTTIPACLLTDKLLGLLDETVDDGRVGYLDDDTVLETRVGVVSVWEVDARQDSLLWTGLQLW